MANIAYCKHCNTKLPPDGSIMCNYVHITNKCPFCGGPNMFDTEGHPHNIGFKQKGGKL